MGPPSSCDPPSGVAAGRAVVVPGAAACAGEAGTLPLPWTWQPRRRGRKRVPAMAGRGGRAELLQKSAMPKQGNEQQLLKCMPEILLPAKLKNLTAPAAMPPVPVHAAGGDGTSVLPAPPNTVFVAPGSHALVSVVALPNSLPAARPTGGRSGPAPVRGLAKNSDRLRGVAARYEHCMRQCCADALHTHGHDTEERLQAALHRCEAACAAGASGCADVPPVVLPKPAADELAGCPAVPPAAASRDTMDWMLHPVLFRALCDKVIAFHQEHGVDLPENFFADWTDGCCDVGGCNSQLPRYCTPCNSFLQQSWVGRSVYAHLPFHAHDTGHFLRKYLRDAGLAHAAGEVSRGLFLVPKWRHAPWWHLTAFFHVLHEWKQGEAGVFTAPPAALGGRRRPVRALPFDVLVLYDPGVSVSPAPAGDTLVHALAVLTASPAHSLEAAGFPAVPVCATHTRRLRAFQAWLRGGPFGWYCRPLAPRGEEAAIHANAPDRSPLTRKFTDIPVVAWGEPAADQDGGSSRPTTWPPLQQPDVQSKPWLVENYNEAMRCRLLANQGHIGFVVKMPNLCKSGYGRQVYARGDTADGDAGLEIAVNRLISKANVDAALTNQPSTSTQASSQHDNELNDLERPWTQGGKLPLHACAAGICNEQGRRAPVCTGLILLKLRIPGIQFRALVDTGASHSVINTRWFEQRAYKLDAAGPQDTLEVANGHTVRSQGVVHLPVTMPTSVCPAHTGIATVSQSTDDKEVSFQQAFIAADLGNSYACILGMDWMRQHRVIVDPASQCVVCRELGNAWACTETLSPLIGKKRKPSALRVCEEVDTATFWQEVGHLRKRLSAINVENPDAYQAYVGAVVVRPAKDAAESETIRKARALGPVKYQANPELEARADALREVIATTLRQEFADVLDGECKGVNTSMPHQHKIELVEGAKPYNQKLRRLSPLESAELSKYLQEMIEGGRIRPSDSPWGANVLFVAKAGGGFRCCQDYRWLNKQTKPDTYPLPRMDVYMDSANGVFWTKMDLLKGFYQMPMHKDSITVTAFNTVQGKYEFLVMPMGLQGAPGSFMKAMNKIFEGLTWDPNVNKSSGVLVYLDDILLYSQTEQEHLALLRKVLERLRQYNLQCRFDKCSFAKTEVEFLGFLLSHQGVRIDPAKFKAITDWPDRMSNKSHVRGFMGTANWMRRFVPHLSGVLAPLHEFAKETYRGPWTDEHTLAVKQVKQVLTSDAIMGVPCVDPQTSNYYPFTVITDASDIAVGAILLQQQSDDRNDIKVIAYESRKFIPAERNYSTHEKELLGVLHAVDVWKCFLEGSKFTVLTDHQSLRWLNGLTDMSRRQARWVDELQGFDFEVLYLKGADNPADGFTRAPYHDTGTEEQDYERKPPFVVVNGMCRGKYFPRILKQFPAEVILCATQRKLDDWSRGSLHYKIVAGYAMDPNFQSREWRVKNGAVFDDQTGLWLTHGKLIIPQITAIVQAVISEHHDTAYGGHLGVNKTVERLQRVFWWPSMVQDIQDYVKSCHHCQRARHATQRPAGLSLPIDPPTEPWQKVHIDFAGPFKRRAPTRHNHVMIIVDSFTKMAKFVRCHNTIDGKQTAELYIDHVWSVFGRPQTIVTDRGTQFVNEFWHTLQTRLGTHSGLTASYHPQANGQAEVMVKQMKKQLIAFEDQGMRWWRVLPACEFAYNDSVNATTGFSPFYLNYGRHPRTPLQSYLTPNEDRTIQEWVVRLQSALAIAHEAAYNRLMIQKAKQREHTNAHRRAATEFSVGDLVYVDRDPAHGLDVKRTGPHTVLEVRNQGRTLQIADWAGPINVERAHLVIVREGDMDAMQSKVLQDIARHTIWKTMQAAQHQLLTAEQKQKRVEQLMKKMFSGQPWKNASGTGDYDAAESLGASLPGATGSTDPLAQLQPSMEPNEEVAMREEGTEEAAEHGAGDDQHMPRDTALSEQGSADANGESESISMAPADPGTPADRDDVHVPLDGELDDSAQASGQPRPRRSTREPDRFADVHGYFYPGAKPIREEPNSGQTDEITTALPADEAVEASEGPERHGLPDPPYTSGATGSRRRARRPDTLEDLQDVLRPGSQVEVPWTPTWSQATLKALRLRDYDLHADAEVMYVP